MQNEIDKEMVLLARELVDTQKEFSIRQMAHAQILCALLNVIDHNSLQRLKKILEIQASSGEFQGLAAESCRLAVQIVSSATEDDVPPDPRKILRLIQGGKEET
jgi:hypothetical protein